MGALFGPRSNAVHRIGLAALLGFPVLAVGGLMAWPFTPYGSRQYQPVVQPLQFDHRHHVLDDGIDCRYCHATVDRGPSAGLPATEVCLNCHSQIWNKSPLLAQVRQSWFTGRPIRWVRVHQLPDFVYFDHSAHVNKGVGCASCHGRVDRMAVVEQVARLDMGWCLGCHRDPAPHLRPLEHLTDMAWTPPEDGGARARRLMQDYRVHARTSCTTCHR